MKMIWAQKWKSLSVAKIKGKTCFRWSVFMINYISAYKSQIMGLDFEVDKLRIKAELRVMVVEL